jgi:hypothetical protein
MSLKPPFSAAIGSRFWVRFLAAPGHRPGRALWRRQEPRHRAPRPDRGSRPYRVTIAAARPPKLPPGRCIGPSKVSPRPSTMVANLEDRIACDGLQCFHVHRRRRKSVHQRATAPRGRRPIRRRPHARPCRAASSKFGPPVLPTTINQSDIRHHMSHHIRHVVPACGGTIQIPQQIQHFRTHSPSAFTARLNMLPEALIGHSTSAPLRPHRSWCPLSSLLTACLQRDRQISSLHWGHT